MTYRTPRSSDVQFEDWLSIPEALEYIRKMTGHKPSRMSFYRWAESGKLVTNGKRPLRTTRGFLAQFIREHIQCSSTKKRGRKIGHRS